MTPSLQERIASYKRDGYTVFEKLFSERLIAAWRAAYPGIVERQTPPGQESPGQKVDIGRPYQLLELHILNALDVKLKVMSQNFHANCLKICML